jgi:hypothetical protein
MEFDIGSLNVDQIRELMARLQNLEVENDRLRVEASRVPTPVQAPPPTVESFSGLSATKIIPRPDKYDGDRKKNKVKEFSRKIQRYLRCLPQVNPELHVDIISGFLTGSADIWFHRWYNGQTSPNATQLLEDLVAHFCPANVTQEARRKLAAFKQRTSVDEYSGRFRTIMEEVEDIEEGEAKTYFINGLKDQIKKEVLLKDLQGELSLDEVEQIAVQIDSILFQNRPLNRGFGFGRGINGTSDRAPMEGIQYNALSLEERTRYQQEDRCFSCKQQKKHANGCRSRYIFRSNNVEIAPEQDAPEAGDD